jgi:predicted lipid-binding transport protein (Tim44 family)
MAVMSLRWLQTVARIVALTAALLVGAEEADARAGGGLAAASPVPIRAGLVAADGGLAHHAALAQLPPNGGSLSDLFHRGGLLGGFAAGFLGSGLLGLLFGRGLIGGLGGVPSYLGLLFQLALIVMLCRLIWSRWRHVDFAGVAGLSPRQLADPYLRSRDDVHAGLDSAAGEDEHAGQSGRAGQIKQTQKPRQ